MVKQPGLIKNSFFCKTITIVAAILIAYAVIVIITTTSILNKTVLSIEKTSGRTVIEKIVDMVKNTNDDLKSFKDYAINEKKTELHNIVNVLCVLINNLVQDGNNIGSKEILKNRTLKNKIFNIVSDLEYGKDGYFIISDYSGKILVQPFSKDKSYSNQANIEGNLPISHIVKEAKKKGSIFLKPFRNINIKNNTEYKKIVYAENMPKFKVVVIAYAYINRIQRILDFRRKQLYMRLSRIIKDTKIGKNGYIYIFNDKGIMLFHPNSNIESTNFKAMINPGTKRYIFDDLKKAAFSNHELRYKWDKPNDKNHYIYEKVSWVYFFPELKWYLASSVYLSDLNLSARRMMNFIIVITLCSLVFLFGFSFMVFKKMLDPILELSRISKEVTAGNYNVRSQYKSDDEIGVLSMEFNKMVDTLEHYINNLDKEVNEKTQKLQDALDYANLIFNNAAIGILVVDENRCIRNVNSMMCKIFGYSEEELLGKSAEILHIDHDHYLEFGSRMFQRAQKEYIIDLIYPAKRKNGDIVWAQITGAPFRKGEFLKGYVIWSFLDCTRMHMDEEKIKKKNAQLEILVNAQSNMVFIIENNKVTIANKAMKYFVGDDNLEKISRDACWFKNMFSPVEGSYMPDKSDQKRKWVKDLLQLDENKRIVSLPDRNNHIRTFKVDINPVPSDPGNESYLIYFNDITAIANESRILKDQANTDPLTGIYNRRRFIKILKEELDKTIIYDTKLSILMFDIDFFKNINDTYGHDIGDIVLKHLSSFIKSLIREQDTLVRWGGEEFIILMPQTSLESAVSKAEVLRKSVAEFNNEQIPAFTISFGVTSYRTGESMDDLLKRVDAALYEAKNSGRNKTVSI